MGIIIEHYAGHFPLWLAPVQARVIAISEKFQDYGAEVLKQLKAAGLRAELVGSDETLGKRVRAAQVEKIPYVLVVGEEEMKAGTVSVRHSTKGDMKTMSAQEIVSLMQKETVDRK
jgi:threonyl-tRNA synthetase